ncbi:MAG: hypothetical protein ACTSUE_00205 [Promethearchaeota archaeon]
MSNNIGISRRKGHIMDLGQLQSKIRRAFARFMEMDQKLLISNVNEVCISSRIAQYLHDEFPNYQVYCEFDRELLNDREGMEWGVKTLSMRKNEYNRIIKKIAEQENILQFLKIINSKKIREDIDLESTIKAELEKEIIDNEEDITFSFKKKRVRPDIILTGYHRYSTIIEIKKTSNTHSIGYLYDYAKAILLKFKFKYNYAVLARVNNTRKTEPTRYKKNVKILWISGDNLNNLHIIGEPEPEFPTIQELTR